MPDKNELSLDELEQVSGGSSTNKVIEHVILGDKLASVYETENHLGEEIYVRAPQVGKCRFFAGTLLASWEGEYQRTIKIAVKYGYGEGTTMDYGLHVGDKDMSAKIWLVVGYR